MRVIDIDYRMDGVFYQKKSNHRGGMAVSRARARSWTETNNVIYV